MIILNVRDRVYLQMLIRDSGSGHDDVAEELSGVNGLVDPFHSPGLVVPSYQELLALQYFVTVYVEATSVRDVL